MINYAQISNKNVLEHFINKTSGKTNTKKKKDKRKQGERKDGNEVWDDGKEMLKEL